jgi:pimeloyl-ACP methyl ester carboxylesterase
METTGTLLIHGGMHTSRCWADVTPLLDSPAVAVDLPGRGTQPADLETVSLDDCITAVLDAADRAGFERFALVGHSLGGVTITETAYRHPSRVTQLVYIGALVPPPGSSASIVMTGADLETMGPMPEEAARALFGNDLTDEQWDAHYRGLVPDAVGIMNARLSGYPTGLPITYVNMSRDVPVPPALAEQIIANLGPGVVRHTIDAGHIVMVSQPERLAEILNRTLAA